MPSGLGLFSRVFNNVSEAPSKMLWFQPQKRRNQSLAAILQEPGVRTDMSTPLDANGMETGAVLSRHFTRPGRDPLVLAPFEERMIEGRSVRVPTSWAPGGLVRLANEVGEASSSEFLTHKAKTFAFQAGEAGVLLEHEPEVLADELAWILARGMGWIAEESGMWVGVLNLHHFCEPVTQRFDLAGLRQAARCLMIAAAGQASRADSPGSFSLGWTNGAGFLLVAGIPYDSSRAVGILGCVSAMILGEAALTSARLAERSPELVQAADSEVVLAGLSHAKAKVSELPPTGQITPPGADTGRWASQTQEVLNEAVSAVSSHGVLGAYPTAPQAVPEAESWLDPISRLAEAIPTLQVSDLAARPEIRSSLKAMGLAESQRGAVLSAIAGGGSILEAGVPETKAPSLKTALGSWSFHPNAQVMMGAAVAPFVAGVLQHRIILPEGIPDEFRTTVMAAAQRFGLAGALPYVHGAKPIDPELEPAQAAEPKEVEEAVSPVLEEHLDQEADTQESALDESETENTAPIEPENDLAGTPVPETSDSGSTELDKGSDSEFTDTTEEVLPEAEEESLPDSSLIPPPLPTEPPAQENEEESVELVESEENPISEETDPATETTTESTSESISEPSQESEASMEPPNVALPEVSEVIEASSVSEDGAGSNALVGAVLAAGAAAVTATSLPQGAPEAEAEAESPQDETPQDLEAPAAPPIEDHRPPESTPDSLGQESVIESGYEEPAPSAQVQPTYWSKTVNLQSQGVDIVLHAFRRTEGGPLEAAVTTYQLTAMNKILLDSLLTSVNLGLSKGVTIKDYARSITQPGLVRDILKALSDLSEN